MNTRHKQENRKTMNEETMEPGKPRSAEEALDELNRELNVRRRCFPRWVKDGRVSNTDAHDRIDRLATAIDLLSAKAAASTEGAA